MSQAPAHRPTAADDLMLRALTYTDPVVRALEAELQQEYVEKYGPRYGTVEEPALDPGEFTPPDGLFLVGFVGAEPVASGGYHQFDEGIVEIKRMFVVSDRRGVGYARHLLSELERRAADQGFKRAVLESGSEQAEALSLYRTAGYESIAAFGKYIGLERSLCFGKDLTPAPPE